MVTVQVRVAAGRARAAAAHWLGGQACWGGRRRVAGPGAPVRRWLSGGWTRLLPGTVVRVSPCASC